MMVGLTDRMISGVLQVFTATPTLNQNIYLGLSIGIFKLALSPLSLLVEILMRSRVRTRNTGAASG